MPNSHIIPFDSAFLMAFHVDHIAVNINGDGFALTLSQQLSEDLEIDFSQHVGCLITEVSAQHGLDIDWVKLTFTIYRREMKGIDWGNLYDEYKGEMFYAEKLEAICACRSLLPRSIQVHTAKKWHIPRLRAAPGSRIFGVPSQPPHSPPLPAPHVFAALRSPFPTIRFEWNF